MTARTPHLSKLVERYPALAPCFDAVAEAAQLLTEVFSSGKKLLICGNGGSAADSEHIVGELMKGFILPRKISESDVARLAAVGGQEGLDVAATLQRALPAIALTSQISLTSAIANDTGSEMVFAQQIFGLGQPGDALLGISTSGNSANVVRAFIVAKARGLKTIALTGRSGGQLVGRADISIRVPADHVAEIQEFHLPVYHALSMELEEHFFSS
jgi:D-sedoheptulose 7-phosphate isomerase